jgi:type II secretory pathway pseudopilin PulG
METVFIIILAVVLLFYFLGRVDKNERNERVKQQQSGAAVLKSKYKTLIEGLNPPDLDVKLVAESQTRIVYELKSAYGITRFTILQLTGQVTVKWVFSHVIMGEHSKNWTFDDNMNQETMLNTIYDDMEQINKRFK